MLFLWSDESDLFFLPSAVISFSLRGYLTKYDCSSADINPIGSISKRDLDGFLRYAMAQWGLDSLERFARLLLPRECCFMEQKDPFRILDAPATAELEPLQEGRLVQTDEVRS